jgi:rubredoxin
LYDKLKTHFPKTYTLVLTMKTTNTTSLSSLSFVVCFFLLLQLLSGRSLAFTTLPPAMRTGCNGVITGGVRPATQLFFFGTPKDDGLPGDYVCKVRVFFDKKQYISIRYPVGQFLICISRVVVLTTALCFQDCGYVFTQGPAAWAKLPDNWSCPPCGSVKRRFTKVPKGSAKTTTTAKKGK